MRALVVLVVPLLLMSLHLLLLSLLLVQCPFPLLLLGHLERLRVPRELHKTQRALGKITHMLSWRTAARVQEPVSGAHVIVGDDLFKFYLFSNIFLLSFYSP